MSLIKSYTYPKASGTSCSGISIPHTHVRRRCGAPYEEYGCSLLLKMKKRNFVVQCPPCAQTDKSKAHQPPPEVPEEMLVLRLMDRLGVDLCHQEGKDFLIMVDMF